MVTHQRAALARSAREPSTLVLQERPEWPGDFCSITQPVAPGGQRQSPSSQATAPFPPSDLPVVGRLGELETGLGSCAPGARLFPHPPPSLPTTHCSALTLPLPSLAPALPQILPRTTDRCFKDAKILSPRQSLSFCENQRQPTRTRPGRPGGLLVTKFLSVYQQSCSPPGDVAARK